VLGLFGFNSRHIANSASLTAPLRTSTKSGVPWKWTTVEQSCFDQLKSCLRENVITAYFDPYRPTRLTTDASPVGLAAVLSQPDINGVHRPITFISRSLTDVEARYSQLERESLAVVWACERLHRYIYGSDVVIHTDHNH
jgi:hypothetical protein